MIYIGVDPGLSGAICSWRPNRPDPLLEVHDMPTLRVKPGSAKRTLDAVELARIIDALVSGLQARALIEQPMPVLRNAGRSVGASSAMANGRNSGIAYGILCAQFIPVEEIAPATWKRAMGVTAAKDSSLARIKQLVPQYAHLFARKRDEGRAEAALIALYAERRFREQAVSP